jgi:hypothetical protein
MIIYNKMEYLTLKTLQELKTPVPTHISNPKYQHWQRSRTGINKEENETSCRQFFS